MTREEIYTQCVQRIDKTNCLLLQLPTGYGKTKLSIDLANHIADNILHRPLSILLLVAKRVHKQTWNSEIQKWGGIKAKTMLAECYESLQKHTGEQWDIILADEVHHIGSEKRMAELRSMHPHYIIGLSATIPQKLQQWFRYNYHSQVVSCHITEAIEDNVLPEPEILLFPLQVENNRLSETIELNPKAKGPVMHGEYKDYWKFKRQKVHAILRCTQAQKLQELNKTIQWYKDKALRNPTMKQSWLYLAGKRLEFLSKCKLPWVKLILQHLQQERTITFCKTIAQTEQLGSNCIHSKNKEAEQVYDDFNAGRIDHITAVNILNENANLVNCRYAIFCNYSSSDVVMPQRIGRSLRHKSPVIIFPYYVGTREEELVLKTIEGFNKDKIRTIKTVSEI